MIQVSTIPPTEHFKAEYKEEAFKVYNSFITGARNFLELADNPLYPKQDRKTFLTMATKNITVVEMLIHINCEERKEEVAALKLAIETRLVEIG